MKLNWKGSTRVQSHRVHFSTHGGTVLARACWNQLFASPSIRFLFGWPAGDLIWNKLYQLRMTHRNFSMPKNLQNARGSRSRGHKKLVRGGIWGDQIHLQAKLLLSGTCRKKILISAGHCYVCRSGNLSPALFLAGLGWSAGQFWFGIANSMLAPLHRRQQNVPGSLQDAVWLYRQTCTFNSLGLYFYFLFFNTVFILWSLFLILYSLNNRPHSSFSLCFKGVWCKKGASDLNTVLWLKSP